MVETDWREILSFSQRELMQSDKEKLCESLSWMEADDIELNFSDLKTLFRLAQDILKYKSEQVNNLLGQLETTQRKGGKGKSKNSFMESPTKSSDSVLETIAHQEEVIQANKEILEQLYADIAELEGRKKKLEEYRNDEDKESESSRDVLSEMNAMAELENEVTMKNRHIRKLLGDVKILEEENTKLKEKVSVLKDKLTEATELIENLTEQLFKMNSESNRLKETLGKCEQAKSKLSHEIELMKKEVSENVAVKENIHEEIKSKVQHWKNIARSKKAEIEALSSENTRLKEDLIHASQSLPSSPKVKINKAEEIKIKELQEKLSEATNQILESANIINLLKAENKQLKATLEDTHDFSISDTKNESDDGKERAMINKLKTKVKRLGIALQGAEEMVAIREKELSEIGSQLQLLKSDEGINALLENLKSKKRKLKFKDGGIKSLVQEVNTLSHLLDDSQLENEAMRLQLNISADQKIPTKGIMRKHRESEQYNAQLIKELRKFENKLVAVELDNRNLNMKIKKMTKRLTDMGCSQEEIDDICRTVDDDDDVMPLNGGGEASTILEKQKLQESKETTESEKEMQTIIEENEGLRKGLQEILNFLKDNSTTTSGVLAVQCPSLEAILNSMEARHAAGWFAPHMAAVMELKAALGGKDALLTALHEARKETFNIMNKLTKETEKSQELEQKLQDIESKNKEPPEEKLYEPPTNIFSGEFGTWMSDKEQNITDFFDRSKIQNMLKNGNLIYEDQLKNGLIYFHGKFKALYEKMTVIAIQTTDDQNKWVIQEEKYKAEIENLKALLSQNEDDPASDMSPGLVNLPTIDSLQRKCSYLEESYKYIRTLHENMKNEYLETKREAMVMAADYETEIQKLMLSIVNLTDKLRCCVSVELFWKQNESFNEMSTKYRKLVEGDVKQKTESIDLLKRLEDDKIDIINSIRWVITETETKENDKLKTLMSNIEQAIFSKQLQQVCLELDEKNKNIEKLESEIFELQEAQSKLIDETLASSTKEDVNLMKDQLENLAEENKILKEQCRHVESQLDIALLQLQDSQQRQMSNDLEINMLRHQILDLQSVGDNKAIVARLSGEVLVVHIQASENHKKIERLTASLNKERQQKLEVEEMLKARQKIFEVYAFRYEAKFRYMFEVMHVLRQQYQGSLPLFSLENFLNHIEEYSRKTYEVDEKLDEIEDLQSTLMMKHSVFDQVLDVSKNKCLQDEDSCQHKLQYIVLQGVHSRELDHCKKKMETLELSHKEILKRCNNLEKTLILTNQGFEKPLDDMGQRRNSIEKDVDRKLEIEDIQSDDDSDSRKSRTITLPKPLILKPAKNNIEKTKGSKDDNADVLMGSPVKALKYNDIPEVVNVFVQTSTLESKKTSKWVQTDEDEEVNKFKQYIRHLEIHIDGVNKELKQIMVDAQQKSEEMLHLNDDKIHLEGKIQNLNKVLFQRDKEIEDLHESLKQLRKQFDDHKYTERMRVSEVAKEDSNTLINALKRLETDKNTIVAEYTELLNKEREEYAKSVKDLQSKVLELQTKLDSKPSDPVNAATLKESISKYTLKIAELEDKCFKSQNELDGCKAELMTYQSEVDRWKDLASERLTKMEQLNSQLEERHCHEVESYKQENEHWLSQLNETQREHMELRSRLTEQKASYVKQLADKDAHIEQLRSMVHGLKTQIVSMQTMISITDPSFDLSAIVEVEEGSDALSQHGSERLELKYDSSIDLHDAHEDYRMSSSSAIWQEPLIERLRREKQLTAKQNAMLRRQIKALAARERRARLDAQNLKNQVFRISTSGGKVATAETAALHNKIASLQAQLMSARRDTHSTVALWDKWKRAQQAAERWQARYEEKCQDVKKLEASVSLAKSAVTRLEKEKRVLLIRLTEVKSEKVLVVEKQDSERSEKVRGSSDLPRSRSPESQGSTAPSVSTRALLDRVQAQQRRIAALEAADKGNEHLVSEYEKALAEITSLKGQVLKLESTLLESQIRIPMKHNQEHEKELEYLKSYCEMLKEENVQLNLKVSSLETVPTTAHHQRINDLEQTVLTLRGLVSKLQSEQKSTGIKRPDSRPSSGRSAPDKNRTQLESYRLEIANLKRSIQDKDLLLERSKEMLKIAAEREDDLLRENASLRRQLGEFEKQRHGFLSA